MSSRVYLTGLFDPPLPKEAEADFYAWVNEAGYYETDNLEGDGQCFCLGWLYWGEAQRFKDELMGHVPEGTTVRVDEESEYTDDGGNSSDFYGPGADEWELKDIDSKIAVLQAERDEVAARLAARKGGQ